jgi:hypothetical protein
MEIQKDLDISLVTDAPTSPDLVDFPLCFGKLPQLRYNRVAQLRHSKTGILRGTYDTKIDKHSRTTTVGTRVYPGRWTLTVKRGVGKREGDYG